MFLNNPSNASHVLSLYTGIFRYAVPHPNPPQQFHQKALETRTSQRSQAREEEENATKKSKKKKNIQEQKRVH